MQETKFNTATLGQTLSKVGLVSQSIAVDALGALGGLAIAWDERAITLTNIHVNHHFIQATFHIIRINVHGHWSSYQCLLSPGRSEYASNFEYVNFAQLYQNLYALDNTR